MNKHVFIFQMDIIDLIVNNSSIGIIFFFLKCNFELIMTFLQTHVHLSAMPTSQHPVNNWCIEINPRPLYIYIFFFYP